MHFFKKYLYRCNVQIIGTSGNPARATLATLGMEVHTLSALAACQKLVLTNMDGSWENGETSDTYPDSEVVRDQISRNCFAAWVSDWG